MRDADFRYYLELHAKDGGFSKDAPVFSRLIDADDRYIGLLLLHMSWRIIWFLSMERNIHIGQSPL